MFCSFLSLSGAVEIISLPKKISRKKIPVIAERRLRRVIIKLGFDLA